MSEMGVNGSARLIDVGALAGGGAGVGTAGSMRRTGLTSGSGAELVRRKRSPDGPPSVDRRATRGMMSKLNVWLGRLRFGSGAMATAAGRFDGDDVPACDWLTAVTIAAGRRGEVLAGRG